MITLCCKQMNKITFHSVRLQRATFQLSLTGWGAKVFCVRGNVGILALHWFKFNAKGSFSLVNTSAFRYLYMCVCVKAQKQMFCLRQYFPKEVISRCPISAKRTIHVPNQFFPCVLPLLSHDFTFRSTPVREQSLQGNFTSLQDNMHYKLMKCDYL